MNTKFFGQFLLEKNIINREQLLEALDSQRSQSPLLGELAVSKGWMDASACKKINAIQMQKDRRFGDIAIDLGLLDDRQVDELLALQRQKRPYLGEVLVLLDHLDRDELEIYLALHQAGQSDRKSFFDDAIARCPEPKSAQAIVDSFPKLFHRICKQPIALTEMASAMYLQDDPSAFEHCWYQDLHVNGDYRVMLVTSSEQGLALGSSFMSMPLTTWDALSIDAVSEFLNTFVGHIYHSVTGGPSADKISPPQYAPSYDLGIATNDMSFVFDTGEYQCTIVLMWKPPL